MKLLLRNFYRWFRPYPMNQSTRLMMNIVFDKMETIMFYTGRVPVSCCADIGSSGQVVSVRFRRGNYRIDYAPGFSFFRIFDDQGRALMQGDYDDFFGIFSDQRTERIDS